MGKNVKIKLELPHFHVSDTYLVSIYPDVPVAPVARAAATGRVSMSTRPDPNISGTVEMATRRRPCIRVVWDCASSPTNKSPGYEVFLPDSVQVRSNLLVRELVLLPLEEVAVTACLRCSIVFDIVPMC